MISKGPQRRENPADAPPGAETTRTEEATLPGSCPKCSTAIPSGGAWCPACGLQVADICGACGGPLASAWSYCPRCGSSAGEPGTVPCPSCREPVSLGFAFCTRCGAQARSLCAGCGRPQRREWAFCPACGTGKEGATGRRGDGAISEAEWPAARNRAAAGPAGSPTDSDAPPRPVAPSPSRPVADSEAEGFNNQGKRAYEADDLDTAITAFQQAVALDPTNADYHTNLAVALDEREMDFEAFAAYQRAIELNPRQVTALLNIGYLYSEKERYEEARQVWEHVIRVDPASEEAQEARNNLQNLDEL